jgi:hypothetical protein
MTETLPTPAYLQNKPGPGLDRENPRTTPIALLLTFQK